MYLMWMDEYTIKLMGKENVSIFLELIGTFKNFR